MENTAPVQPTGLLTDAEFAALLEAEGFALPACLTEEA
jgi:hypothetical protein